LLRCLIDDGVVDAAAAVEGRVTVMDLSRSNPVGLVHVDGCPEVVVKGGTASDDGIDPISAEIAAYHWLNTSAHTARLAPSPLLDAARGMAVVTRPLIGGVSLHEALGSGACGEEALIAELGRILGVLHGAGDGFRDLSARRPWILDVPAGHKPLLAVGNEPASQVVETIAQCAPVAAAISSVERAWASRTVIHGDIKFDNVLVAHDRMLLVDWELAGLGAPVWDLAGVIDGLLIPCCVKERDFAVGLALVDSFGASALTAHRTVAGVGLSPTLEELAAAVVARMSQTATQLAAMSHDHPDAGETSRLVMGAVIELARELVIDSKLIAECTP
jgi:tRNA A-37 threonylcarbamoyl transferase component Bud32